MSKTAKTRSSTRAMDVDVPRIGAAAPFSWGNEAKDVVTAYKLYLMQMKSRVEQLEHHGPTGQE